MDVLITAGPTREPIDSVRYISNRSSGRMGVALARAAAKCDAVTRVTLLAGPGVLDEANHAALHEQGVHVARFESTADLQMLLGEHWPAHDRLIMAAAVADYRPTQMHAGKLSRNADSAMHLSLEPTPDLVAELAATKRDDQRIIAFALEEPAQLESRAAAKLQRKGVDAIVANPLQTMDADAVDAVWLDAVGGRERPGAMSKVDFAAWLIKKVTA